MKGIVFGAGFLGTKIAEKFNYTLSKIDVLDRSVLEQTLEQTKPDIVINAVGKTGSPNIDWCETHKEETFMSNVVAAANIGIACSKKKIYSVHFGSGGIYTGKNKKFDEEDEPNFYLQTYARTKIISEKILKEFQCLQLRIHMPLDDRPHEKNLIDKLKSYKKIADVKSSMTSVPDMLNALENLIEKRKIGVYNVINSGLISFVEIMEMYKEIVDPTHKFEIISNKELNKMLLNKKADGILDTSKLAKEGIIMPDIHDAVKLCLIDYKKNLDKSQ
ncbi:sugar nucleotide-binding protein [Candidatus Pacearchaeota archaeon]|nr:sugar nucleotide-binding protein [Candidatus Pacearchaeota archaeon]